MNGDSTQELQYAKTIEDTIIEFLKSNLPEGYFKNFYYGDPYEIPESLLPAICVEKIKTDVLQGATGQDHIIYTVMIKLLYCKKEDFGKNDSEALGIRTLENYAEGIDPTTGEYDSHSVAGILRKNFTLGQILTDQTILINYGVVPRGDLLTAECHITVAIDERKLVTGRA
jgi:hypothetical protein